MYIKLGNFAVFSVVWIGLIISILKELGIVMKKARSDFTKDSLAYRNAYRLANYSKINAVFGILLCILHVASKLSYKGLIAKNDVTLTLVINIMYDISCIGVSYG